MEDIDSLRSVILVIDERPKERLPAETKQRETEKQRFKEIRYYAVMLLWKFLTALRTWRA